MVEGAYVCEPISNYDRPGAQIYINMMSFITFGRHEDKGGEGCDIILDDISLGDEPEFRKGVVAKAVEEAVATGSLYFSSTGNFRNGYKFTSVSSFTLHQLFEI